MDYNQFINIEYFFYKIYQFFAFVWNLIFGHGDLYGNFSQYSGLAKTFLEILVVLFLVGIIYCLIRVYEIRKEEQAKLDKAHVVIEKAPIQNAEWEKILKKMESDNASDWRLAIIDADNMLDAMLKKMGYIGEDLGERLKAVEPSDFDTLESAWEAHKTRNQIVHQGVSFEISKRDADRVIDMYERVFREFEYI